MPDHHRGIVATMRETFWLLVLAIIVLFAFFLGLGTFSVSDVGWLTAGVVLLVALWCIHGWNMHRHRDDPKDERLVRARERRGF
jgi:fatty acid desaturase